MSDKNQSRNNKTESYGTQKSTLIDLISKDLHITNKESILGIGDDAALIDIGTAYLVISTSMFIERIHFDLTYFPLKHVGYKVVVAAISNICAMNTLPKQLLTSMAMSNRFSVEAIKELYWGIKKACKDYNIDLIGGDTTSSSSGLTISLTALGTCDKNLACKRSGAQKNDIICVSGDLGAAYLGLKILDVEKKIFLEDSEMKPELERYKHILQRYLMPSARIDIINNLCYHNVIPTSMIDLSNGLAVHLLDIAKKSKVGVSIYENKIPINNETQIAAERFKLNPLVCALHGGQDYELAFTVRQKDFEKIEKEQSIFPIGYVKDKEEGNHLITGAGELIPIE